MSTSQQRPGGAVRLAVLLRDAANYIKKMRKSERDKAEWRLVIQMLIDAAEDVAPMLFAKWAILYAVEQSFNPTLNDQYWRRRKPMRYRCGDLCSMHRVNMQIEWISRNRRVHFASASLRRSHSENNDRRSTR